MPNEIDDIVTSPIPFDSKFRGIINNQYVKGIATTSWNPRSGGLSKVVFRGNQETIVPVASMCKDAGYEYALTTGHVWVLEVTAPYDVVTDPTAQDQPLAIWEVTNTPFEKDIFELGDRPFNADLNQATISQIEKKLRNPDQVAYPYTTSDKVPGDVAINATVAYNLKAIGVHGRQAAITTIRKTMIISNQFTPTDTATFLHPKYDYQIFTKPYWTLVYDTNTDRFPLNLVPQVMWDALPQYLTVAKWNNDQPPTATLTQTQGYNMDAKGIVTYIGYLQFPAEFQMVSFNKVQVTQNWSFNQWSAGPWGLYDPYSGAAETSPNPNDVLHLKTTP